MSVDHPEQDYPALYRDHDVRSAVVYDNDTERRHFLLSDGRAETATFGDSFENRLAGTLDDVPPEIREFSAIDEPVSSGPEIEHTDEIEDRLEHLGYR